MQPISFLDRAAGAAVTASPRDHGPTPTAAQLVPLVSERIGRREPAQLLVPVDGSAASTRQLVWALQEAARREATVLAVAVVNADADGETRTIARTLLDAQFLHAVGLTGVHACGRTALLEPAVYSALVGSAGGADLVMVGPHRKTVLRPATRQPSVRRPMTRCA